MFTIIPTGVYAEQETIKLSRNGMEVTIDLPPDCTFESQIFDWSSLSNLGDIQVSLSIDSTSVKKEAALTKSVYEGLKEDNPDTTFFEELPDLVTDMGTFTVRKISYIGASGDTWTSLQAFCKLNYRYIYSITLRGDGGIDYDMLEQFASAKVIKTPFKWDKEISGLAIGHAALGFVIILYEYRKKHFRPRSTGVIKGFDRHRKHTDIVITYYQEDGTKTTGKHSMITLGGEYYRRKIDREVAITYSKRRPQNVDIISYKMRYVVGMFFLVFAGLYICLMVFGV